LLPHELPPWPVVYQRTQRWLAVGCFEAIVHDLRAVLRLTIGRAPQPTAVVLDGRTLQSHARERPPRRLRRAQVARAVQDATGESVERAYVDQGSTGEERAEAAETHGIRLEVFKHAEAKRGFALLLRRWAVERSFAWAVCFRRLARDYERLPQTLAGLHFVAFACLMLTPSSFVLGPLHVHNSLSRAVRRQAAPRSPSPSAELLPAL
jgi:transposase